MIRTSHVYLSIALLTLVALPGCWNMCDGPRAQEHQEAVNAVQPAQEVVPAQQEQPQPKAAKTYGSAVAITTADRLDAILKEGSPVILDFWAQWCGPCKHMKPIFEKLAGKHKHVRFVTIDTDALQDKDLMKKYGVDAFPTFVFIDANGKVVDTQQGGSSEEGFDAKVAQLFPAGNP